MLKAIDLFSGPGGLTEGLKQAGFEVIGAVEIDPVAISTYKLNHDCHVWESDIRNISGDAILKDLHLKPGELDLLAGCPPCQGFSTMRTRRKSGSVEDDRNDLVYEFLRLVDALRPKAILMENVPNLATDPRMRVFLSTIKRWGYYAEPDAIRIVDAANYGVAQRRRRMMLVSTITGKTAFAPRDDFGPTVRDVLGSICPPDKSWDTLHNYSIRSSELVKARISAVPIDGGSRSALPPELQLDCHKKSNGFRDVYGRMAWNEVSPTITSGCTNPSKGRFIHPDQDRPITLREAALLQSFPADYKFDLRGGRGAVARMIGNALPPEMIKRHADHLRNLLNQNCGELS